jgi:diaminohydroxyphosphoribosylaminopyrimidine deaminase/5-amino-6-(5-phosphoribosylamino)uracil reductase
MPIDEHDLRQLTRTLELAKSAIGRSDPNPRVGCVIADRDGRVIGEGATQRAGQAHAEVMALRAAHEAGASPRGGTAWVSLEPCSHHGRTPPCADALVAAGLGRVVVATADPNPQVAGAGLQRLRDADIAVEVAEGPLAQQARELNVGFFSRMRRGLPWVRCKLAASLDGRTALDSGVSQWITGETARVDGHAWRRRAGAVLAGTGTILADDPRLDVRLVPTEIQPLRVVIDSRLRTPPRARVLDPPGTALIYCAIAASAAGAALRKRGADVVERPTASGGLVDLPAVLTDLAARGVNELHVEAGPTLTGALLQGDLVDEFVVYLAPRLIGQGRGMIEAQLGALSDAWSLHFESVQAVGDDLRIVARRPQALNWLDSSP